VRPSISPETSSCRAPRVPLAVATRVRPFSPPASPSSVSPWPPEQIASSGHRQVFHALRPRLLPSPGARIPMTCV
jgi:hypothetical protein